MSDDARQRMSRAAAARVLISLAEKGQLAEPERWDMETLDRLPVWCLFDEARWRRLQTVCGAVLLAPEIRLWIDRRRLALLADVLGDTCLDRLLMRADTLVASLSVDSIGESAARDGLSHDADRGAIEQYLAAAGASVLRGSLHPSLPVAALDAALGESAGHLSESVALEVLALGEALLDVVEDVEPTTTDTDSSRNARAEVAA